MIQVATKKESTGKKAPKEIIKTLNANVSRVDIFMPSANQFESIRNGQPVFHDIEANVHVIVIDSVIYSTPSRGLIYPKLLELIRRGLAGSEIPKLMKHCNDGPLSLKLGSTAADWTHTALTDKLSEFEKKCQGGFGTPKYLVATDFKTEKQFVNATECGYLSQKDYKHGTAKKYANGPVYYFAMENGFGPNDAELALNLGIKDTETLIFVLDGNFTSLAAAKEAEANGFTDNEIWNEAINLGCTTYDQYLAITEHDWPSLSDYNQAISFGFKEDETKLFNDLISVPHYKNYLNAIRNGCKASLHLFRTAAEMIDFQYEAGYDKYWKALILNHLRSVKGRNVSYEAIVAVANLDSHPFEEGNKSEVLNFLVTDDQVNEIGRAIPRDERFSLFKDRKQHQAILTSGE